MAWRLARSIDVLRDELDAAHPNRSKASDGTIGDPDHASRHSDHNPWVKDRHGVGVVRAIDVTHDPTGGCDAGQLADHFRRLGLRGDPRIAYVIWNRKIYNPSISNAWRHYSGANPHTMHVHLSVSTDQRHYDSTDPWGIEQEGLSVADIDKLKELIKFQAGVTRKTVRAQTEAVLRALVKIDRQVPGNLEAEIDEIRRALRETDGEPADPDA